MLVAVAQDHGVPLSRPGLPQHAANAMLGPMELRPHVRHDAHLCRGLDGYGEFGHLTPLVFPNKPLSLALLVIASKS